jgi:hypothetical protein
MSNKDVPLNIQECLVQQDDDVLASWWSTLNSNEWPEALPKTEECEGIDIMHWIMHFIGIKECLRDWNKKRMPGNSFDTWWEQRGK